MSVEISCFLSPYKCFSEPYKCLNSFPTAAYLKYFTFLILRIMINFRFMNHLRSFVYFDKHRKLFNWWWLATLTPFLWSVKGQIIFLSSHHFQFTTIILYQIYVSLTTQLLKQPPGISWYMQIVSKHFKSFVETQSLEKSIIEVLRALKGAAFK